MRVRATKPVGPSNSPCLNPSNHNTSLASLFSTCFATAPASNIESCDCSTHSESRGVYSACNTTCHHQNVLLRVEGPYEATSGWS